VRYRFDDVGSNFIVLAWASSNGDVTEAALIANSLIEAIGSDDA
jgi:hypothetical protein